MARPKEFDEAVALSDLTRHIGIERSKPNSTVGKVSGK